VRRRPPKILWPVLVALAVGFQANFQFSILTAFLQELDPLGNAPVIALPPRIRRLSEVPARVVRELLVSMGDLIRSTAS
jgi:hypothetical protein